MKLLFLNSIDPAVWGGMEEWIRLVAHGLSLRGHEVAVAGRESSEFLRRVRTGKGVVSLLPLSISGDFNPFTIAAVSDYLRHEEVDVLVTNFNKDIRIGGIASWRHSRTRVIWSAGLDITRDTLAHRMLTPRLLDGVLVPSESLKQQVTRHGYIEPAVVTVVPIGIPNLPQVPDRAACRSQLVQKFGLPGDAVIGITCGRLVEQKGHRHLIEALPSIIKSCPQFYAVFLGDGPLHADLQAQAQSLGVEKHVLYLGMQDDVTPWLAGADLMIHPSIEEPFGIALLEGMRVGLPVAASRVGGIPEVLAETQTLFAPRHPEDLAAKVAPLVASADIRQQLGKVARERFYSQFTEDKLLDRLESYFQAQMAESRNHA